MERIKWTNNVMPATEDKNLAIMSSKEVRIARDFHESIPGYDKTPLVHLKNLAKYWGIKDVFVKDESYRFDLNAFKVLGGSYAMAKYIAQQTHHPIEEMTFQKLTSQELKDEFGQATFFTATDGNHGRGVAWAANKLGQKSVIHMPKGSSLTRLENIQKEGATATIEEVNYDDCVRIANEEAMNTPNGVMVQDTAWDGYEEIPSWIMQGYGTMALEASEQISKKPTHIFVQAGVGSLAGAVIGFFSNYYKEKNEKPPIMVVVESKSADCLYRSALAHDGKIRFVDGDLHTMMAGLACGEPNTISWDILRNHADFFVSCPDWVSAKGMRILATPLKGDDTVISGESGAVTTGLMGALMWDESYDDMKTELGIDENSVVLLFSTEGNTDPSMFRRVVWDGFEPSVKNDINHF